jgi:hypothetical protein
MKSKLRRLECKKIIKGYELGDICKKDLKRY